VNQVPQQYPFPQSRRPLDTAEGILIALRHCTANEAFHEIVNTSRQHRIPVFSLATALITVAIGNPDSANPAARAAVQTQWGHLLSLSDQ
jgi:hypothetical protein